VERKTGLSLFLCTGFEVLGWSTWIARWEMANLNRFLSCWPSVSGLAKFGLPILARADRSTPPVRTAKKTLSIIYINDVAALKPVFRSTAPQTPDWWAVAGVPSLEAVQPLHVATWIEGQTRTHAAPTVKQRLAAIRHLFDWLAQ